MAASDENELRGLYDAPLLDFEDDNVEKTETDQEAERDLARDEIVEALGADEADVSDVADDGEADQDGDGDADGDNF